ncbi:MAG: HAMP domain-containing histidine kinase, partial [Roseburia sp.]|nr:HAMP domain-containing histidine kinase [Roseburia sp.]
MRETQNMEKTQNLLLERMSHELRTPMNSIIGLTYLSKENIDNPKQVLENLDKIERSVKFLRSFMDDILNLSLLESGRVADEKREISFVQFLEELTGPVKSMAEEKQLLFFTEQRGALGQNYCFDGDKLKAALANIMENAVKFTPAGGRVDFIAELLQDNSGSGKFRFEVRDTGIGMSEEFLPKIFEPFEQEEEGGT